MITKPVSNKTKYIYIIQSVVSSKYNTPYFATDKAEAARLRAVKRTYYPGERVKQWRIPLKAASIRYFK